MNLYKLRMDLYYQKAATTGGSERECWIAYGSKAPGFTRVQSQEFFDGLEAEHKDRTALGPYAVAINNLRLRESEFTVNLIELAHKVELTNPQDLREHASDLENLIKGAQYKGAGWRQGCVALLEKLSLAGLDVTEVETEARALFPNEYNEQETD